ncbi:VanZ family protein [Streptomyces sp. KM273126]|uniref:VanZ family protein n=1 Tax=Streptomyces sp. KM273126 TaxID=2545247 RepID=UPI00103A6718|nr:VanZ family protein [Streptomyces sp. KM273126]MBA2810798.1 VanZ family protein [Streptomyces sp. KM273126]
MARTTSRSPTSTARRRSKAAPRGRRALSFPLRLLAMATAFAAMVAFAAVLARLTLQPSPASEALTHSNLHPGRSLEAYLNQPALRDAVKQIGGNILLGVPFGVLLPMLAPGTRGILRVPVLTAMVMLLVELVQGAMITGRAFDIDDVILNTTGALLGYVLLGRRLGHAVHPPEQSKPSGRKSRRRPRFRILRRKAHKRPSAAAR